MIQQPLLRTVLCSQGLQRMLTKHSAHVYHFTKNHSSTIKQPLVLPLTPADPAAGHWAQVVATAKGTADTEPSSAPTSSTPTTSTGVTSSQRLTLAEAEAALSAALTSSSGALSAERAHERFLRLVLHFITASITTATNSLVFNHSKTRSCTIQTVAQHALARCELAVYRLPSLRLCSL
jgi:hypothetical protein